MASANRSSRAEENIRNTICGAVSGLLTAGMFNPWDRALWEMLKYLIFPQRGTFLNFYFPHMHTNTHTLSLNLALTRTKTTHNDIVKRTFNTPKQKKISCTAAQPALSFDCKLPSAIWRLPPDGVAARGHRRHVFPGTARLVAAKRRPSPPLPFFASTEHCFQFPLLFVWFCVCVCVCVIVWPSACWCCQVHAAHSQLTDVHPSTHHCSRGRHVCGPSQRRFDESLVLHQIPILGNSAPGPNTFNNCWDLWKGRHHSIHEGHKTHDTSRCCVGWLLQLDTPRIVSTDEEIVCWL